MIATGRIAIIGAKHNLATGEVTWFNDTWVHDEASIRGVTGRPVVNPVQSSVAGAKGIAATKWWWETHENTIFNSAPATTQGG